MGIGPWWSMLYSHQKATMEEVFVRLKSSRSGELREQSSLWFIENPPVVLLAVPPTVSWLEPLKAKGKQKTDRDEHTTKGLTGLWSLVLQNAARWFIQCGPTAPCSLAWWLLVSCSKRMSWIFLKKMLKMQVLRRLSSLLIILPRRWFCGKQKCHRNKTLE